MPQLDLFSYFSQFIWTTFIFFLFVLILVKYFLPPIARALLFQEKKYIQRQIDTSTDRPLYTKEREDFLQATLLLWKSAHVVLQKTFLDTTTPSPLSILLLSFLQQRKSFFCSAVSQKNFFVLLANPKKQAVLFENAFLHGSS